jgi:hypothetical protein
VPPQSRRIRCLGGYLVSHAQLASQLRDEVLEVTDAFLGECGGRLGLQGISVRH